MRVSEITNIFEQVGKIKIRSITDSLFKFGLLFILLGVITSVFKLQTWTTISILALGGLLILTGLIFYIYFALKYPDYLRSESFQLKKRSIEMLGDKENQYNPNVHRIIEITSPNNEDSQSKIIDKIED